MTPSPVMVVRLRRGGAYLADLALLRAQAVAGKGVASVLPVTVIHPASPARFEAYLNLSRPVPAGAAPAPPHAAASFDILGFRNAHGAWHFRVPGTASLPDAAMPGAPRDADAGAAAVAYDPGAPDAWPAIDNAALGRDVAALAAYAGEPVGPALRDGLARMRIVLSDALRIDAVAAGVNAVLVGAGSFRPSPATLRGPDGAPPAAPRHPGCLPIANG